MDSVNKKLGHFYQRFYSNYLMQHVNRIICLPYIETASKGRCVLLC